MCLAPASVLVVVGGGERFSEAPTGTRILANATGGHAEEMVPTCGFPIRAKATFVVVGIYRATVRTRHLPAEDGCGLGVHQAVDKRTKPVGALGSGVGVQEYDVLGSAEIYSAIHDPTRDIL